MYAYSFITNFSDGPYPSPLLYNSSFENDLYIRSNYLKSTYLNYIAVRLYEPTIKPYGYDDNLNQQSAIFVLYMSEEYE